MTILKISIIRRVHIGVWQASETISRIDLLMLPQNLLSWGAPISVGPSSVLPGDRATNLESPLMISLSQPSPFFFVSKSCSFCFHILSRTQPFLPSSPAAITHSACCSGLFRPLQPVSPHSSQKDSVQIQVTACCPSVHSPHVALLSLRVFAGPEKASLGLAPMAPLFSPPYYCLYPYSLLSDLAWLLSLPLTCPARSSLRVVHPGHPLPGLTCSPGHRGPDSLTSFRCLLKCHLLGAYPPLTTLSKITTPSLPHFFHSSSHHLTYSLTHLCSFLTVFPHENENSTRAEIFVLFTAVSPAPGPQ